MPGYYADKLAADRLRRCYELAPPPTRAYLRAEIDFVRERCRATMSLLELGCGYGRVLLGLRGAARWMVGIDTSPASLALGCEARDTADRIDLLAMDATRLGFADGKARAWLHEAHVVAEERQDDDGWVIAVDWTARQKAEFATLAV